MTSFDGVRLRSLRLERGLTAQAVADRIGVAFPRVFEWESGVVSPSIRNLKALARVFAVAPAELLDIDTEAPGLIELRELAGHSRQSAADRAGVSYSALYSYETGRRQPPTTVVSALAKLYRVTRAEIAAALERGQ